MMCMRRPSIFDGSEVESIAVGLLWSVANPRHELRVREILGGMLPDVPVTLSHEINPIPREYRRIIAAAIDASISPIIRSYVQRLRDALAAAGFNGRAAAGQLPRRHDAARRR